MSNDDDDGDDDRLFSLFLFVIIVPTTLSPKIERKLLNWFESWLKKFFWYFILKKKSKILISLSIFNV